MYVCLDFYRYKLIAFVTALFVNTSMSAQTRLMFEYFVAESTSVKI